MHLELFKTKHYITDNMSIGRNYLEKQIMIVFWDKINTTKNQIVLSSIKYSNDIS